MKITTSERKRYRYAVIRYGILTNKPILHSLHRLKRSATESYNKLKREGRKASIRKI